MTQLLILQSKSSGLRNFYFNARYIYFCAILREILSKQFKISFALCNWLSFFSKVKLIRSSCELTNDNYKERKLNEGYVSGNTGKIWLLIVFSLKKNSVLWTLKWFGGDIYIYCIFATRIEK